jgi:hypothetical protein
LLELHVKGVFVCAVARLAAEAKYETELESVLSANATREQIEAAIKVAELHLSKNNDVLARARARLNREQWVRDLKEADAQRNLPRLEAMCANAEKVRDCFGGE